MVVEAEVVEAFATSWPSLSLQVGFTRLAASYTWRNSGKSELRMPSTSLKQSMLQGVDARHKAGHDGD